jgi:hypothetical protein
MVTTEVVWRGWDGSEWALHDPNGGVVMLRDGVEGLHMPKFKQYVRTSPAVPGQVFTGSIAEPRSLFFKVLVWEEGTSGQWVERDRAFWHSMHPAREGILTISPAGAGSRRSIAARLVPDNYQFPIDPGLARWAEYPVTLIADDPFWRGETVRAGWLAASTGEEFYEETGPHLINIGPGHTTAGAVVPNMGDEPAWPVWTIIGPGSDAHVGVGANVVDVPFTVVAGKALVIDTDPRVRTAIEYTYTPPTGYGAPEVLTGPVDRTADLTGDVNFAAIPPGASSPVNIAITGTGAIRVELVPRYWRAW